MATNWKNTELLKNGPKVEQHVNYYPIKREADLLLCVLQTPGSLFLILVASGQLVPPITTTDDISRHI